MSLTDTDLSNHHPTLLELARASILHGLEAHQPLTVKVSDYIPILIARRATFVTLKQHGKLRGCIGTLEAIRPLVQDVVCNAYSAGFCDPRFTPVTESDVLELDIHISILGPASPVEFTSEEDLIAQLRPNQDGLIIEEGTHRGTFLPSVWTSIPDAESFLQHLKQKAGLTENYWSKTLKIYRYTTESIGADS